MTRIVNFAIIVLATIATLLMFVSSGEPILPLIKDSQIAPMLYALSWPNTILFNLSVGYLISVIFWLLVVYLPDKFRRRLLRDTLAKRYEEFKQEIVQIFIWASGESGDIQFVYDLAKDHVKFKEYFRSNDVRWNEVLNGIQKSELRMHELLFAMKMFSNEVAYVLNNVPFDDPSVHGVFKRLNESIFRLRESDTDLYDRVNHVGNFLWALLARWDIIKGQLEEDIIEKMIRHI